MSYSTITFYEAKKWSNTITSPACILYKNNNAKIDDIESYLSLAYSVSSPAIEGASHLFEKVELNCKKKIVFSQAYEYRGRAVPSYMKVMTSISGGNYPVYYFINSIKWTSEKVGEFDLTLDTLNTFDTYKKGEVPQTARQCYNILETTKIQREHKDRFSTTLRGSKNVKIIDSTPENINPSLFNNVYSTMNLAGNSGGEAPNSDFYLAYITNNEKSDNLEKNPVKCYLFASDEIPLSATSTGGYIHPSTLTSNTMYVLPLYGSWDVVPKAMNQYDLFFIYKYGSSAIRYGFIKKNSVVGYLANGGVSSIYIKGIDKLYTTNVTESSLYLDTPTEAQWQANKEILLDNITGELSTGFSQYKRVAKITELDRTQARLVKLLKLPYAPCEIYKPSGATYYNYNTSLFEAEDTLKLKDLNSQFFNNLLLTYQRNEINIDLLTCIDLSSVTPNSEASIDLESKLLNSEFFSYKIMYDSFVYPVNFEELNLSGSYNFTKLAVNFRPTRTINSKFLFDFSFPRQYSAENYPQFLVIGRNNEETIYNNTYLNYLRTGYNYDVKAKEQQVSNAWINAGISQVTTSASFLENPSLVNYTLSTVNNFKNAMLTSISAERSFASKISELKASSASVAGSDDVDLMSVYSGNRLKIAVASPKNYLKNQLFKFFYLFGYASERFGYPDFKSRIWFNFVQCDLKVNNVQIQAEFMQDIISRYSAGVTHYHKYNGTYDTEQTKENLETSML